MPDDDQRTNALVLAARKAAESGQPRLAAERLQDLLSTPRSSVVALRPREIYVSPGRWAQIQLLAGAAPFGAEVLKAWRQLYGGQGDAALRGAILAADLLEIRRLLRRFPLATSAPFGCLALADHALLHGDPDAAFGHLLRLLDHVPLAERDAWVKGEAYRTRRVHLKSLATRHAAGWPTIGGDATRARNGSALPDKLALLWSAPLTEHPAELLDRPQEPDWSETLPFYPVCDDQRLYVNCGQFIQVIDRAGGKVLDTWPKGLKESDAGQVRLATRLPGVRGATLGHGLLYANLLTLHDDKFRSSALYAFDKESGQPRWRAAPGTKQGRAFLRGTPALRGDRLYVYGAVREWVEDNPTSKEEAFLFCFDAHTGDEIWRRFLGYGRTHAAPQLPPQSGLAPAVAAGVVIVSTGLGVAAALDAEDGEVLWLLRYSRPREKERLRLINEAENETTVQERPAWKREPPRIFGDSVLITAPDAAEATLCWLRGHLSAQGYHVDQDGYAREWHALYEYVAGIRKGRPYFVGRRGKNQSVASYQAVFAPGEPQRFGLLPAENRALNDPIRVPPDLFGRPLIAGRVLLIPTRNAVFRFDLSGEQAELKPLAPIRSANVEAEEDAPFGTLIAVEGLLYAVTRKSIHCYGPAPR